MCVSSQCPARPNGVAALRTLCLLTRAPAATARTEFGPGADTSDPYYDPPCRAVDPELPAMGPARASQLAWEASDPVVPDLRRVLTGTDHDFNGDGFVTGVRDVPGGHVVDGCRVVCQVPWVCLVLLFVAIDLTVIVSCRSISRTSPLVMWPGLASGRATSRSSGMEPGNAGSSG